MASPISITGLTEFNSARNHVANINVAVDAGLVPIKIPLVASSSNLGLNMLGRSVEITITGHYTGTVAQMTAFVLEFRTWADISQIAGNTVDRKTFTDRFDSWFVKPMRFIYDDNLAVVSRVTYVMTLYRSADPNA